MQTVAPNESRRLPGLDGLRAIAVVAVMFFHADFAFARGGYLGVDLFFVLSGFLITRLLIDEVERSGTVTPLAFYTRRAKRLLPALFMMVAGTTILACLAAPDALGRLRDDTFASAVFLTNWHFIAQQTTYFEFTGRQPLLQHLWSLAIEEQFYLLWPLVVLGFLRIGGRTALGCAAIMLAVASGLWMHTLATQLGYPERVDVSRVYFGTDTHALGLLAGAALAAFARRISDEAELRTRFAHAAGFTAGSGALLATLGLFATLGENSGWLYPYGFAGAALCGVLLIVACIQPGGSFGALLDLPPLRWLGERSYGIYLWHWPIYLFTRPEIDLPLDPWPAFALRISLTIILAALSYRYVEAPILGRAATGPTLAPRYAVGLVVAAVALAQAFALRTDFAAAQSARAAAEAALLAKIEPPRVREDTVLLERGVRYAGGVTVIGDSVALGARATLEATLDDAVVYAQVGWQAADMLQLLQRIQAAGELRPKVLIHLGTNGYVTEQQLRKMLDLLRDREQVLFMNSRVPRRWMAANNELLKEIIPRYPNAALIDWEGASANKPEFFVTDGIHLSSAGKRAYVAGIVKAGRFRRLTVDVAVPADLRDALQPLEPEPSEPQDYSPTLVRYPEPIAPDSFWREMARCESNSNWSDGGEFAGGLGIYVGSWREWGGGEFAETPDKATPEQQIIVANRISTQGWLRPDGSVQQAVGFFGWGCLRVIGRPTLLMFTPESLLKQKFRWGQRGQAVRDLQTLLEQPATGVYDAATATAHLARLEAAELPTTLAAMPPADKPAT